jgi:hypothetical protein
MSNLNAEQWGNQTDPLPNVLLRLPFFRILRKIPARDLHANSSHVTHLIAQEL